jgi:hypothetical protein
MPLADENRHGPTDVACELDSRRANLTSALGSIESEQSASRGSCLSPIKAGLDPDTRGHDAGLEDTAAGTGDFRIAGFRQR